MALDSSEEVFIKTVNCQPRRQEQFAHFVCVTAGRDTMLVPGINMDLGFKYRVQLSQHLCGFVVLIPPMTYQSSLCLVEGRCVKKELFRVWLHPLCINALFHTWEQSQFFSFFSFSFNHLVSPSLTSLCLFLYMREKKNCRCQHSLNLVKMKFIQKATELSEPVIGFWATSEKRLDLVSTFY